MTTRLQRGSISPVPGAVQSSSCSDLDTAATSDSSDDNTNGRHSPVASASAGAAVVGSSSVVKSPHGTCMQRSLSAAIVSDPNVQHEILKGRTKILVPPMPTLHRSHTVPSHPELYSKITCGPPAPLRLDAWSEAAATCFSIRGPTYLQDSMKIASDESVFQLLTVDLVQSDQPNLKGMCSHPNERIQQALRIEQDTGIPQLPEFVFAVNLCVPASASMAAVNKTGSSVGSGSATPSGGGGIGRSLRRGKKNNNNNQAVVDDTTSTTSTTTNSSKKSAACYHCVFYFGLEDKTLITNNPQTPEGQLAQKFFFGNSDAFRDKTFKLIPRIVEGNFVVRKAVGSKPSLLGTKLKQHYIRTDRYMELIVDIGSDTVANRIVKLALGYAKNLTVDMMFLLEGTTPQTLPERILGGVRIKNVDFKKRDGQRKCSSSSS